MVKYDSANNALKNSKVSLFYHFEVDYSTIDINGLPISGNKETINNDGKITVDTNKIKKS